ncbi:MAG: hypothetical protein J6C16_01150 [Clostridia bacterium]|nr:hypothetical protein [Clostridia bacterium]
MEITLNEITTRLSQIGYEVQETDTSLIQKELDKIFEFIKISCNLIDISEEFKNVIIERTCGNFLFLLKNYGRFDGIDNLGFVKEILEGDVKVVFDENSVLSNEQRLDKIIDYLMGYGQEIIISKRCICW